MAGLPTTQRDQILLAVGVLGIVGAVAFYFLWTTKRADERAVLTSRIERLDASNNRARALLARGTVEELRAEAQTLQDNLRVLRRLIPSGNEVPALLDQIVGAARRTGLAIESFAPGPQVQGELFDTYRYSMNMKGTYHEIAEMLTAIGSLPRIIAPVNLRLLPLTAVEQRAVRADQRMLSASFDIQTYVVKTGPAEGETPP
jgi:type IV pilus assembly protein PilO